MSRPLTASCGFVFLATLVAASGQPFQGRPLADALAAYESGNFDRVEHLLQTVATQLQDARSFQNGLAQQLESWVSLGGQRQERRRLIAAAIVLELLTAKIRQGRLADWDRIRDLAEYACRFLRSSPPQPLERQWHLALIALVESVGDYRFFPERPPLGDPEYWKVEHIKHVRSRFPNDARWDFALATNAEQRSWLTPDEPRMPVLSDSTELRAKILAGGQFWGNSVRVDPGARLDQDLTLWWSKRAPVDFVTLAKNRELWALVSRWRALLGVDEVAAEAHLRLGHTFLRLARTDLAFPEFEAADQKATSTFVRYLALIRGGMILEQIGQLRDAETAYRSALALVPLADSASIRLANLLYLRGEAVAAEAMLVAATSDEAAADPFRDYRQGNPGTWDRAITALRVGLR